MVVLAASGCTQPDRPWSACSEGLIALWSFCYVYVTCREAIPIPRSPASPSPLNPDAVGLDQFFGTRLLRAEAASCCFGHSPRCPWDPSKSTSTLPKVPSEPSGMQGLNGSLEKGASKA